MRIAIILAMVVGTGGCRLSYTGGAKAVAPATVADEGNGDWKHAVETPVVRQRARTDCGLAALAMMAGAWGRAWTVEDLARAMPVGKRGVKLRVLRDYAREHGLEAYALRGKHADLEHELGQGRPVMLGLVLPFEKDRAVSHYEVAVAIGRDGTVVTRDPATGALMQRSRQVLDDEWRNAGYAMLVVVSDRRAGTATASLTTKEDLK